MTAVKPKQIRTIYDLAELAGVSAATVSRALAAKTVVSNETAERIRKLAQQHGFQPSALARNLRTRRSGAIGVVIPLGHERAQHISDPFFMTMIGCLADELTERDFDLVLSRVIPDKPNWLETMIAKARVDGFIIIGQSDQSAVLDAAARTYLPMVAWGAFTRGQVHCSVGTDNFLGGRMATEHLIARGSRNIVFLGNTQAIEIAQRLEGAKAAVRAGRRAGRAGGSHHPPRQRIERRRYRGLSGQRRAHAGRHFRSLRHDRADRHPDPRVARHVGARRRAGRRLRRSADCPQHRPAAHHHPAGYPDRRGADDRLPVPPHRRQADRLDRPQPRTGRPRDELSAHGDVRHCIRKTHYMRAKFALQSISLSVYQPLGSMQGSPECRKACGSGTPSSGAALPLPARLSSLSDRGIDLA
ncbi:DNA-binding LacI/PurR family transcriptional regulator [Sphingobium sp. B1D3A]|uniref:DNA-binding LacI/PurR family transcriptional regulator n=1 Tax=Sphingobium lignivorans TaxID=2735886 RepID=A0ABR6NE70_9SPHN|nr:DNA-binding LacI/PurR family transcriptional regulator [Sphingobium lignivorans]